MRRFLSALLPALALGGGLTAAAAQTAPATPTTTSAKPAKHKPDPYQSPWATIMQSHIWTHVPEAQGFVRDSRPAPKDLKYTPLQSQLGPDPERPKPRDAANVMALQAELEASLAHNTARGGHPAKARHRAKANAAAD